jgi:ABC-2 type transport system ATP-binding protein
MEIIEVVKATKKFKEVIVLNNITVSFAAGKIHGIIGRNGSGKTVLMRLICGLLRLTEGEIRVRGKIVGKDIDMPPDIGIVIEHPGFLPTFSGFRNLQYLAKVRNIIGRDQICESIRLVGLDPESKKHVSKYSMGMRQRLAIAQAIMENPDILILDEPMNGLDKDGVIEIREIIKKLKEQGKTILLASHNPLDITELCDTIYEMDGGSITKLK